MARHDQIQPESPLRRAGANACLFMAAHDHPWQSFPAAAGVLWALMSYDTATSDHEATNRSGLDTSDERRSQYRFLEQHAGQSCGAGRGAAGGDSGAEAWNRPQGCDRQDSHATTGVRGVGRRAGACCRSTLKKWLRCERIPYGRPCLAGLVLRSACGRTVARLIR